MNGNYKIIGSELLEDTLDRFKDLGYGDTKFKCAQVIDELFEVMVIVERFYKNEEVIKGHEKEAGIKLFKELISDFKKLDYGSNEQLGLVVLLKIFNVMTLIRKYYARE